jgi:hypothetical protein
MKKGCMLYLGLIMGIKELRDYFEKVYARFLREEDYDKKERCREIPRKRD